MKEIFLGCVCLFWLFPFWGYQRMEVPIGRSNYHLQNEKVPTADIETVGSKSKIVALHNLAADYDDDVTCGVSKPCIGTITEVSYDSQFTQRVTGFSVKALDGTKSFINIDQDLYEKFKLSRLELSLIPTLLVKGKKVRIVSYQCGVSGRVEMLHEVKVVK